jgi:AcrR family transcriptional regulator
MGRPKVPLISRRNVIQVGLGIVESEGIDALTMRRLAQELGVNGASFYHHFSSKEDILSSIARAALAELEVPELGDDEDWREWFARTAVRYRTFLINRPFMIPLMVDGYVPRATLPTAATAIRRLTDQGIPAEEHQLILDTIEAFVVGSALMYAHTHKDEKGPSRSKRITPEDDDVFLAMAALLTKGLTEHFTNNRPAVNGKTRSRARAQRD